MNKLTNLSSHPLPPGATINVNGENVKTDPYGAPLEYLIAGEIDKQLDNLSIKSQWNRAIIVFIKYLPHETPIILFWQ